ncbi:hypothetical protein BOX15_Mlig000851g1 [Macrostomum lignano]|uniref:Reticulocalbin-3 n=2 Tax=Macrostomum lignano TaxID=282301 RepID=A0A1I8GA22_9PLAT|nr:hypothetical protein BOX15_Mlig000851g1 [Macrostomum lignano]
MSNCHSSVLPLMTLAVIAVTLAVSLPSAQASPAVVKADSSHKDSGDRVYQHDLSDLDHDEDEDEDDHKYDHEAFLGKEDSSKFDKMSPEESKANLGKIVDKIDKDNDGMVTEKELSDWIDYISKRYVTEDSRKQFLDYASSPADKLSWDTYKARNFGKDTDEATSKSMSRDERRWQRADRDGDGMLSLAEFTDFTHPEEAPHMRELVGLETLEDMDKDKDGGVDINEYIADMWTPSAGEQEPDWVKTERETFSNVRDKNKDGRLDQAEIASWIVPEDYNHVEAETRHLMSQADTDKDGRLSRQEIMDKYDVFVGSQATDFGEALGKHEEL